MKTELVSIATDSAPLDGLYYQPEEGAIKGCILLMHGNTMNFYVGAPRFLPPILVPQGFACLAFNRRGHDVLSTYDSRETIGGAFQSVEQAIEDNRLAAKWLKAKGLPAPIVIGHSNGGMLAVRHVADHPETPALVLLSAHAGGPGLFRKASETGLFGGDRYDEIEAQAKQMVAQGKGSELLLLPGWYHVISAASFLDVTTNMPDILQLAPKINTRVLYVRGDQEPAHMYPAEEFSRLSKGTCDIEIIDNCDHFYRGREDVIAKLVSNWLEVRFNHSK